MIYFSISMAFQDRIGGFDSQQLVFNLESRVWDQLTRWRTDNATLARMIGGSVEDSSNKKKRKKIEHRQAGGQARAADPSTACRRLVRGAPAGACMGRRAVRPYLSARLGRSTRLGCKSVSRIDAQKTYLGRHGKRHLGSTCPGQWQRCP